jgi:HSP20 family molecular chaperone IbpA
LRGGDQRKKDKHHFFVERYCGSFERKINLPKSEEARKKEIKIKVH